MSTSPYSPYLPKKRRQKAWYAVAPALTQSTHTTVVNALNRGTRLPADVIPKIVDYWAHVGWYAIERDQRDECEVFLDSGRFGLRSREF